MHFRVDYWIKGDPFNQKSRRASEKMRSGEPLHLSIGIVFHNEENQLESFFSELQKSLYRDIAFEILGYDNCSTDHSYSIFMKECDRRNWQVKAHQSKRNNMGEARDWITRTAKAEFLYFIDVDVSPKIESIDKLLKALSEHRDDPKISAAAGPLYVEVSNKFQQRLAYLQASWWGNFGSAQMKMDFKTDRLSCAPTAHLMIKRLDYLSIGSFSKTFDRSGEDLEIQRRLSKLGKQIIWQSDAAASHNVATHLQQWLMKAFKYGQAQTQIAKVHPAFFLTKKCLPLWILLFCMTSLATMPEIFCFFIGCYFLSLLYVSVRLSIKHCFSLVGLFFFTHLYYLIGEIFGLVKSPEISTREK